MAFLQMQGTAKLQQVTQLLKSLEKDLQEHNLSTADRVQTLLQLRQHGTNPTNAEPIYSQNGINTLVRYGVEGETPDVRRAALRCVANALLLEPEMRQAFVDTGYGGKLAEKLKTEDSEDEMVTSRILFYATYNTTLDFKDLIKSHELGDNVNYQLSRHAKQFPKSGRKPLSQMDELALSDTLKLIYNISKIFPDLATEFSPSIPHILKIICRIDIPAKPLDGLVGGLLNTLSILDLEEKKGKIFESSPLFPTFDPNCNVAKLISILDQAVSIYSPNELEANAVPLLYSLVAIHEVAPDGPRKYMQSLLLPEDTDRSLPIGQSETLSSRLLKLSTTHFANLKVTISELMFVLSDKDAEKLTKNIGYGFAAGFLAARGIEMPQSASEASAKDDPESARNPITGQRWAAEPQDSGPPMTMEEKEREAERLFVLFERAKANGLINVENPVTQALHEGRFEELPDDTDSD
ncbi:Guanine nucleotide exchange factor Ric8 [Penicillium concentricum]|uniref:Guanine nucleotide exchange factor Ric8 n=1 Tax=Penicillium concentricum TaxID=293559 RepID=A0A9W9VJR5_9EURO|nr:Guanine nucleotide exchange factor Ric8 [Penicillium concentricum]KAJ5384773.1 Guanine nucleotide exchange factor Ric8 [Penicillium concentricum]